MALSSVSLLALGGIALTVAQPPEQSRCPDPAVTQQLIDERVDQDATHGHEIQLDPVTDVQSGQSYVRLRLYNMERAILMERLIPVDGKDCSVVPLAVAIIVENYFSKVGPRKPKPTAAPTASEGAAHATPESAIDEGSSGAPTQGSSPNELPSSTDTSSGGWPRVRLGAGLKVGPAGAVSFELAFNYFYTRLGYVDVAVDGRAIKTRRTDGPFEIASTVQSVYLGSGLNIPLARPLALALAPQFGMHYERAALRGQDVISEGTKSRFMLSLGAKAQFLAHLTDHLWLGLGTRAGYLLGGARFVVSVPNRPPEEVDPLPRFDWDAQALFGYQF